MDDHSASRRATPARGGTVEPADRAAIAKDRFQAPHEEAEHRFELRDPFLDVTYRAKTLGEMTAKAEQLGATRITAIGGDGTRTPIQKIDGSWQRGPSLAALPMRPEDSSTSRDDVPDARAEPRTSSAPPKHAEPAAKASPKEAITASAEATARIDAEAERAAMVARIEMSLTERYVIKRAPVTVGDVKIGSTEYRFRGDSSRVAFTESTFRLATDTNSPSVARSMVDLAQARNWRGVRVSGAEDFRRLVWLEASVRGVKAVGYKPNVADLEILKREREARQINRIEPTADTRTGSDATTSEKSSARGGGRKAVVAAIEAALIAMQVPEANRQSVLAAAAEQLSAQQSRGERVPKIRVYDRSAARQSSITQPAPDVSRGPDRAAPAHSR